MRVRIATTALLAALAAGCGGGHSATTGLGWARHAGVFSARVRVALIHPGSRRSAGPPRRMLVDTATGRFRIATGSATSPDGLLSVSGNRTATRASGSPAHRIVTQYRGSRHFLTGVVGGIPLEIVEAFLAGSAPPPGVHLRVVSNGPPATIVATTATERLRITIRRAAHVPAHAFRTARGKPARVVRELRPGARPDGAIAAYWLGPAWNGRAARSSSAASGRVGYYAIRYPHLDVVVTAPAGITGGQTLTLGDGTHARLRVAPVEADGTVSVAGGTPFSMHGFVFTTTEPPGSTMAFVFLPHAMVTLSGTAVTPRSAAAIARSLRPL